MQNINRIQWLMTCSWLLLIFSLFYDPISSWLTLPDNQISPFSIQPENCVNFQNTCIQQTPYELGASIFWGIGVPGIIFGLLVFGHIFWRRICPLSFLSQLPGALGLQRKRNHFDRYSKKYRRKSVIIKPQSWLGRNHIYLQLILLYLGLCLRLLLVNHHRLSLGIFLLVTILIAMFINYLYGGKTWCHYFCPMLPVQKIFCEPEGLINPQQNKSKNRKVSKIPQSMCRTTNSQGQEIPDCVGCKTHCIDIDIEAAYWKGITKAEQRWLYYGYVGLTIGFFSYNYLYAGNWEYYFSGIWANPNTSMDTLFAPGFYIWEYPIPIPKLLAVPLTLALSTLGSYCLGCHVERIYKSYLIKRQKYYNLRLVRHRFFTLCTFLIFNFFFIFGAGNFILLLPNTLQN
ncbi:MAG: 4Fe-4S binding protein, partial [Cyanobacteria bacterium P01_G01_bin.49]